MDDIKIQIEGPTQDDSQDVPVAASDASRAKQGMTILSLEVFGKLLLQHVTFKQNESLYTH
jgi:hypothetical protein